MTAKRYPSESEIQDMLERGEINRNEFVEMMDQRVRQQALDDMTGMQRQRFDEVAAQDGGKTGPPQKNRRSVAPWVVVAVLVGIGVVVGLALLLLGSVRG